MIRVLVVDDHPIVRSGVAGMLAGLPDIEVVGEADDGETAIRLAIELHPDVILLDLRMPGLDGLDAIPRLLAPSSSPQPKSSPRENPRTPSSSKIIVLTTYHTEADVLRATEAGAVGYLLKDTPKAELVAAIRAAAAGETVIATPAAQVLHAAAARPAPRLTPRELEVLRGVAAGLANPQIAGQLHVSPATVKTHLLRAFAKLGVTDRTAAATTAAERGWL